MSTPNDAWGSYRPTGYGLSPGLQRARQPFRLQNAVTGIAIATFVVGVWAYSISAVKQDVFDDVDEEARALNATERKEQPFTQSQPLTSSANIMTGNLTEESTSLSPQSVGLANPPRGVLFAALGERQPWLFEPIHKTLVWGAPPVDRIGGIQDKVIAAWRK